MRIAGWKNRDTKEHFLSSLFVAQDKKDWSGVSKGREAPLGLRKR
jgi:hypothetical protein